MRIAVPCANGKLCMHFGHCEEFVVLEANPEEKTLGKAEKMTPPPHEPGVLPRWLHEKGVDMIIAGGMGSRAQALFTQAGISVVVGAPLGTPEELVTSWMEGSLAAGENVCDH